MHAIARTKNGALPLFQGKISFFTLNFRCKIFSNFFFRHTTSYFFIKLYVSLFLTFYIWSFYSFSLYPSIPSFLFSKNNIYIWIWPDETGSATFHLGKKTIWFRVSRFVTIKRSGIAFSLHPDEIVLKKYTMEI